METDRSSAKQEGIDLRSDFHLTLTKCLMLTILNSLTTYFAVPSQACGSSWFCMCACACGREGGSQMCGSILPSSLEGQDEDMKSGIVEGCRSGRLPRRPETRGRGRECRARSSLRGCYHLLIKETLKFTSSVPVQVDMMLEAKCTPSPASR